MAPATFAQPSATAEALFRNGLQEMEAGRYEAACPSIAESYRLDARPGTLFTLAECEAKAGRIASAVAHYGDYVAVFSRMPEDQRQRQRGREAIARQQMDSLRPNVPQMIVTLPKDAPVGTSVRMDSIELGAPSLGMSLPVDPGEHRLTVQVPGLQPRSTTVAIGVGETLRVELELPEAPPVEPPRPEPPPATASSVRTERDEGSRGTSDQGESRRVVAYVLGGLALEGLAVGTVTGILAWQKKGAVERECPDAYCSADGMDAADAGTTYATVSTVSFGIGLAALAGAWIAWPGGASEVGSARASMRPVVGRTGEGSALFGVRGGF
jgi:hypothetical protein